MGFVEELRGVLGSGRVKDHPLEMHIYDKDAGVTRGPVTAVALPETTEETAHCVRTARRWDVPIVARGAGTGLAGGAVPTQPGLLVVMTRMNEIWEVDADNR